MRQAEILRPGMMMTVQDSGRRGMLRFGVSGAGPMDPDAMRMANALVGNPADAATLEFAFFGGAIRFGDDRMVAVCGAVRDLRIGGNPVAPWQSHLVRAGQELTIGAMAETVWGYVAIGGGIGTQPVLGARSTHLRTGIGGIEGRTLQAGDALPLGGAEPVPMRKLGAPWRVRSGAIHVVPGPQDDRFGAAAVTDFLRGPFTVTQKRDRMAMVLDGPRIHAEMGHDIVSDGTLPGSIQVPGSGQPLVLLSDRQTTGGYPKIATIASVDLSRLAQMVSGRPFRFTAISQSRAEDMLIAHRDAFSRALAEVETAR
ncbi:5-oxoprolinase subunit C family protein [Falsirhodobacter xinxiangensis]|uniref:5-oxoprolinase subunit C family protein n=1 Tax=Falsirhodobacter xinxiangensis TaxID=2530049 RepID=UPI0010AB3A50|nr:biotin-dependent carboxyltransferase family protein [Rhodobacter xinxiangensis]